MECKANHYRVLQIEAWPDGGDGNWSWNNWWHIDNAPVVDVERDPNGCAGLWAIFNEHVRADRRVYRIEDDQYNYVLTERKTGMPVCALEYGDMRDDEGCRLC